MCKCRDVSDWIHVTLWQAPHRSIAPNSSHSLLLAESVMSTEGSSRPRVVRTVLPAFVILRDPPLGHMGGLAKPPRGFGPVPCLYNIKQSYDIEVFFGSELEWIGDNIAESPRGI